MRPRAAAGRRWRPSWREERGSALLISMVLIFVMTLLGLALFDLAALESRLALVTQVDVRALEVAQAGIERALWETWQDWVGSGDQNWSNASCLDAGGSTVACSTAAFQLLYVKDLDIRNGVPGGGRYSISVKLLTLAEAATAPYYQTCTDNGSGVCKDLVLVRSTGTTGTTEGGAIAGFGTTRTVQALARATTNPGSVFPGGGGVMSGATAGGGISGNVRVAGSIHLLGNSPALDMSGSAGQRNSWADLDSGSLSRLNPLPKVCAPGTTCDVTNPADPNVVETLNATLRVAPRTQWGSETADVMLSGSANKIGVSSATETYSADASRKGKGSIDGVYVDDRYQNRDPGYTPNLPSFSDTSKVWVDGGNVSRGYEGTPPAFPLLTDPVKIAGTSYDHYACVSGSSCAGSADFFVSRAANLFASSDYVNTLGSSAGLKDTTAAFTIPVSFTNKSGAAVSGQICWQRTTGTNLPPANTLELGSPTCATPTGPSNPLLLYFPSSTPSSTGFKIERAGGATAMNYRGAAVFVTNGKVKIEETFQSVCTAAPCTGQKFLESNLLSLMTSGNMDVGEDNSNIDRVMGIFYTEQTFTSKKQTNIVGSVMANTFTFTTNVPSLFQVPVEYASLPEEVRALGSTGGSTLSYAVSRVPRFWRECGAGATPTVPSTATGACGY